MIREQFYRYAAERVEPYAHEWHLKDELIPMEIIQELAEMGGARLSKMDCSDTTRSLQASLEGQFKKSFLGLNVGDPEVEKLFLVSPQNTSS